MKTKSLRCVAAAALAVLPSAVLMAFPGFTGPCYEKTWLNTTTSTTDGCSTYTLCPGRVLCMPNGTKKDTTAIVMGPVACKDFTNGTQNPDGSCSGGTPVVGVSTTVIIWNQDCYNACAL